MAMNRIQFQPDLSMPEFYKLFCTEYLDRLARFSTVPQAGCPYECTVVAGLKPKDVPKLQCINTVRGNIKTSLSGGYHSFGFKKYTEQYFGTFAYRFNRQFNLKTLPQRLLVEAAQCGPHSQHSIRAVVGVHC